MRYGVQWVLPQAQVHWARAGDAGLELPHMPDGADMLR
jgi:hypothetical protein